jgi:hypothetical protein
VKRHQNSRNPHQHSLVRVFHFWGRWSKRWANADPWRTLSRTCAGTGTARHGTAPPTLPNHRSREDLRKFDVELPNGVKLKNINNDEDAARAKKLLESIGPIAQPIATRPTFPELPRTLGPRLRAATASYVKELYKSRLQKKKGIEDKEAIYEQFAAQSKDPHCGAIGKAMVLAFKEELASMRLDNVRKEGGVEFFAIASTKNANSVRKLPFHKVIRAWGFPDYVKMRKNRDPGGMLFPDLPPGKNGYCKNVSRRFNESSTDWKRRLESVRPAWSLPLPSGIDTCSPWLRGFLHKEGCHVQRTTTESRSARH